MARKKSNVHDLVAPGRKLTGKPNLHTALEKSVAILQGHFPEMAGYIVFAVDKCGHWSVGFRLDSAEDNPIGARMMAGLAIMGIQEDLVNVPTTCKIMNGEEL